ncbi:hypothetical protein U9M48_011867, partial [Paspalum notatum var. saurae]
MMPRKLSCYLAPTVVAVLVAVLLAPLAAGDTLSQKCVTDGRNYTTNSTYQSNLKLLSTTLPETAAASPSRLFAVAAAGTTPDVRHLRAHALPRRRRRRLGVRRLRRHRLRGRAAGTWPSTTTPATSADNSGQYISADGENATTSPAAAAAFDAAVGALLDAVADHAVQLPLRTLPFFSGAPMLHLAAAAAAPAPASAERGRTRIKSSSTTTILSIALGIVSSALVAALVFICVWSRRRRPQVSLQYLSNTENVESVTLPFLDLSTLKVVTENFAERNKLGELYGYLKNHMGALPDGEQIAVKRLSQGSTQGIGELKNELLHHKNLVRLVRVCLEEHEKLVVYEYMPNRSLDTILFEQEYNLGWGERFRIINGIARGLQYVHEESRLKIIHRDLKSSNILLDSDLNPKISDFGLARLFEQDKQKTGYMAPEYAIRGQYSTKSNVYSFGVLVLDIITGRRSCGFYNSDQAVDLLALIWENWANGTTPVIVDPFLSSFSEDEVQTCVHVALLCVQESPMDRPTMSAVNLILSTGTTSSLQIPSKPAFCIPADISSDSEPQRGVLLDQLTGRPGQGCVRKM